jgi:hypothetical protein
MSLKSLSIVAAAALALCAGSAQAAMGPVELVVNGNFDAGFTGWDQAGAIAGTQSIDATGGVGGSAAYHVNNSPGFPANSFIKNANRGNDLVAGEAVIVSFDAKGSFADGGVASVEVFSERIGGGTNPPGANYQFWNMPGFNADTFTTFSFTYFVSTQAAPGEPAGAPGGLTILLGATTGGAPNSSANVFYDNVSMTVMREMPPIPEPSTYALMLAGLAGVGLLAKRRRQA